MSPIRNRRSVDRGQLCQRQAQKFFEAEDYEEALHIYEEAERLYRDGYEPPGSRVFFMQTTVLRCLEELLGAGGVEFFSQYQQKAFAFFSEWTDYKIREHIAARDREQALDFRLWRESYSKATPQFTAANAALARKAFEEARQCLDELISNLQKNPFPESDALCSIARTKREIIKVIEERQKPENEQSVSEIVEAYKAAASASRLPESSTSRQRHRIDAYRDIHMSQAFKFEAFAWLRREVQPNPMQALSNAAQLLAKAWKKAELAVSKGAVEQFSESHVLYLRFWHVVVLERLQILKYVETRIEEDFMKAVQAWEEALSIAQKFVNEYGERRIFPNRFYSLDDLRIEEIFLKSLHAFLQKKWSLSVDYLEDWRRKLPAEFRFSWRDMQVNIRLLFAKALRGFSEGNQLDLREAATELSRLGSAEPIGNVGRFLVSEARTLQMKLGTELSDEYVARLASYFPLDSYTDSFQATSEIDPSFSLPKKIFAWMEQTAHATSKAEVAGFKPKLLGCIEGLLGYILDFHLQVLSFDEAPPQEGLVKLLEKLSAPALSSLQKRKALRACLENLRKATEEVYDVADPEAYSKIYETLRGAVKELVRITPVLIEIESDVPSSEVSRYITATPDWMLTLSRPERDKLFIRFPAGTSVRQGWYYLPPEWGKGTTTAYDISERRPLLPVRYEPAWDFWEQDAAIASFLSLEGVSVEHLETAIELAGKCKPEDDRVHPKVGAVILKDEKVVAQAYRNRDGKGRHAEEIAIEECEKEYLEGAVLITTMEPCTKRGRRAQRLCSEMVLYYGIATVVYGIPDPNPDIRGKSEFLFRKNDIRVIHFPRKYAEKVWVLNEDFIQKHTKDSFRSVFLYKSS